MEKTKNGYYKAAAILNFVFGALTAAIVLLFIVLLASGALYEIAHEELLMEYGGIESPEFLEAFRIEKLAINITVIISSIIYAGSCVVMFIAGARFNKFSYLTNEEANKYSGKALAWTIVSYFFCGVLIGILATVGYVNIQSEQKKKYLKGTTSAQNEPVAEVKLNENIYTLENLEKLKLRLTKLKELKETGAISDEEYNAMRDKVMGNKKEAIQEKTEVVDDTPGELNSLKLSRMTERLNKVKALKDSGAINDEEYESLRKKIISSEN